VTSTAATAFSLAGGAGFPSMLVPLAIMLAGALLGLVAILVLVFVLARHRVRAAGDRVEGFFRSLGFVRTEAAYGLMTRYVAHREGREITASLAPATRSRRSVYPRPPALFLRVTAAAPSRFAVAPAFRGQATVQGLIGMQPFDAGPAYAGLHVGAQDAGFARALVQDMRAAAIIRRITAQTPSGWGELAIGDGKVGVNVYGVAPESLTHDLVHYWLTQIWSLLPVVEAHQRR
jgi:hypothetical protein